MPRSSPRCCRSPSHPALPPLQPSLSSTGCIPVFVGEPFHSLPLASDVDYASFALFLNVTDASAWLNATSPKWEHNNMVRRCARCARCAPAVRAVLCRGSSLPLFTAHSSLALSPVPSPPPSSPPLQIRKAWKLDDPSIAKHIVTVERLADAVNYLRSLPADEVARRQGALAAHRLKFWYPPASAAARTAAGTAAALAAEHPDEGEQDAAMVEETDEDYEAAAAAEDEEEEHAYIHGDSEEDDEERARR